MEEESSNESVIRPEPIEKPTRELVQPSKRSLVAPKISEKQEKNIVFASMCIPFDEMQCTVPGLEKLSQMEIKRIFSAKLSNPPKRGLINDFDINVPFTNDEKLELLIFSRRNIEISKVFEFCPSLLPIRSISSILEELRLLSSFSDEDKRVFYEEMTQKILREELCYLSYEQESSDELANPKELKGFRCLPHETVFDECTKEAGKEMNDLKSRANDYLVSTFEKNDLALLRTEKYSFSMKKIRISIGRATKSSTPDIDLGLIPGFDCSHVSNIQCVISFVDNFEFYLENVGMFSIRVNGVQIPPNAACRLKSWCVIDIFGILLMFLPNTAVVEKIRDEYKKKQNKNKKQKNKK